MDPSSLPRSARRPLSRGLLLLLGLFLAGPAAAQSSQDDAGCERCHGDVEFLRQHTDNLESATRLSVDLDRILASAHFENTCSDCHQGFARWPHPENGTTESCASCHEEQDTAWHSGMHAEPVTPDTEPAECVDCHTLHDVLSVADIREGPGVQAMNANCVSCHESSAFDPWDAHADSVPCSGCHLPHLSPGVDTPDAWVAPMNQATMCGECHEEPGANALKDAHGGALREDEFVTLSALTEAGVDAAPTCTSCHGTHGMRAIEDPLSVESLQDQCTACHQEYSDRYYGTYHGKATVLGSEIVATCADCHSSHEIYATDDPSSWVHEDNLVETCADCHEQSRAAFVLYDSHPDPMDPSRNAPLFFSYVFMNTLLFGVLIVFGLHTFLWWVRILIDERKGHGHGGAQHG